jgi:hypothetical protein
MSAIGGLGLGLLGTVGVGTALADTITKSVNYTCTYPLIGARDLQVNLTAAGIPQQVTVNTPTPTIRVDTHNVLGADTIEGLNAVGAKTLEGTARAAVTVSAPEGNINATVSQTLQKISVPASGTSTIDSFGTRTPLTFTQAGQATITLGNLALRVTPKKADGSATGMGSFDVTCTPKNGNVTLATFQIVSDQVTNTPPDLTPPSWVASQGAPDTTEPVTKLHYDLSLNGSSFIKGANGNVPIIGGIGVDVDGATGAIAGPLTLNPGQGSFAILGFLPVTSDISFTQTGNTTGKYAGGIIDTSSTMNVNYANFNVFGAIPIAGGSTCSTASPISVAMHSDRTQLFNPYKGGSFVADDYTLPALNGNCGPLGGIVSIFEQGSGNTITAKLAPKS